MDMTPILMHKDSAEVEMDLDRREDFHAFVQERGSGVVPCQAMIYPTVWDEHPRFFEALDEDTPHVSFSVPRNPERAQESTRDDQWGCRWHYPGRHLDGQVIRHPLAEWQSMATYRVPSPEQFVDWRQVERSARKRRQSDLTVWGHVEHGFLYLRLTSLRGFNNFMLDIAEQRSEILELRDRILDYWVCVVQRWLEIGVDVISFADDLGHQDALPMQPAIWREVFKPAYTELFGMCRQQGVVTYLHTDGYIVDVIADLLAAGVQILNPQDLVNGVDRLADLAKGKTILDLDIDRQRITVFGTAGEIDPHVRNCVQTLGSPAGGLMLKYAVYPGTSKENAARVICSMERHRDMWL